MSYLLWQTLRLRQSCNPLYHGVNSSLKRNTCFLCELFKTNELRTACFFPVVTSIGQKQAKNERSLLSRLLPMWSIKVDNIHMILFDSHQVLPLIWRHYKHNYRVIICSTTSKKEMQIKIIFIGRYHYHKLLQTRGKKHSTYCSSVSRSSEYSPSSE